MAQLGAGYRPRSPCDPDGNFDMVVVAENQQGMAEIWNRLCIPHRLLSCGVFRVWVLTFDLEWDQFWVSSG